MTFKNILVSIMLTLLFACAMQARAQARPLDGNGNVIGGRPAGCPHAYCGCGLARFLGLTDPRLNLAANWARIFPPTRAQSGAVAVKSHHVMLLVALHGDGSRALVRDYNSGGGLSRIHVRSIKGFHFVSPSLASPAKLSGSKEASHRSIHSGRTHSHRNASNAGRGKPFALDAGDNSWRS